MAVSETVFGFDQISANNPQYTAAQTLAWLWQTLRRNDGVAQDLDLALAVTSDGLGNVLTQNGAAFLSGRSYVLSGGPQTTAMTPAPASGFQTSYAIVVRFVTATAVGTITSIAGSTIANPGPPVNPSIVAATDILLAYVKAVNTAGTIVYTVTDARTFCGIGPAGIDTFYGHSALSLQYASTGSGFTAVGFEALKIASTTSPSTAFGYRALLSLTTGVRNTAIGYQSLMALTTGTNNTAIGNSALAATTTGVFNTAVGTNALTLNTIGTQNTAIGSSSLAANTTGGFNTAVGYLSLTANTTGQDNAAVGTGALQSNTTGVQNTGIGSGSLSANTVGTNNTAIGYRSLAANTTGIQNTAVANSALAANTGGIQNTAVGDSALAANTIGTSGTAIGSSALVSNTTGTNNTAVGAASLNTNTTGSNNTGIGFNAISTTATSGNQITLGNSSVTILRAQVTIITALSDARDKRDINNLPDMLALIRAVKPVTFRWDMRERYATKDDAGQILRDENGCPIYDGVSDGTLADEHETLGVISQDLKALQESFNMPYLNLVHDENPNRLEATPGHLLLPAIKAIQELADRVDALTHKVNRLIG
jgi:hypothetical protein